MRDRAKRWTLVPALLVCLVASACGTGGKSTLEINIHRVALDLAFRGDKTAVADRGPVPAPIPDLRITQGRLEVVEAPPPPRAPAPGLTLPKAPIPLPNACPAAPDGATPQEPATATVEKPPLAGTYLIRNKGRIRLSGVFNLEAPYPPITRTSVSAITDEVVPPSDPLSTSATRTIRYTVEKNLGASSVTDVLAITSGQIALERRTVKGTSGEVTFTPQPPVTLVTLNGAVTWNSAGADVSNGTTMAVQGAIVGRARVDVCGELFETYRVSSSEATASLMSATPFTMMTTDRAAPGSEPGQPNYYDVATHKGGLFILEENHTTTQLGSTTIAIDNVGTFMSLVPES